MGTSPVGLPPGFELDPTPAQASALPPGFELDAPAQPGILDKAKAVGRQAWETVTKPAAAGLQEALGNPNPERATVTGAYDLASGAVRQMFDDGRMFGPGFTGDVVRGVGTVADELGRGVAGLADFAMSPLGVALPAAGKFIGPAGHAAIGAGFAADMAEPTAQAIQQAVDDPSLRNVTRAGRADGHDAAAAGRRWSDGPPQPGAGAGVGSGATERPLLSKWPGYRRVSRLIRRQRRRCGLAGRWASGLFGLRFGKQGS